MQNIYLSYSIRFGFNLFIRLKRPHIQCVCISTGDPIIFTFVLKTQCIHARVHSRFSRSLFINANIVIEPYLCVFCECENVNQLEFTYDVDVHSYYRLMHSTQWLWTVRLLWIFLLKITSAKRDFEFECHLRLLSIVIFIYCDHFEWNCEHFASRLLLSMPFEFNAVLCAFLLSLESRYDLDKVGFGAKHEFWFNSHEIQRIRQRFHLFHG